MTSNDFLFLKLITGIWEIIFLNQKHFLFTIRYFQTEVGLNININPSVSQECSQVKVGLFIFIIDCRVTASAGLRWHTY